MIFIFFKLIFFIGFIINMQFSKIDCNVNAVVALLKIEMNNYHRYVPEIFRTYKTRNQILLDVETKMPFLYNLVSHTTTISNDVDDEVNDEFSYHINTELQLIMKKNDAEKFLGDKYLATINIMKHTEFLEGSSNVEKGYMAEFRQHQFNSYLLYPHDNENIYNYWDRIDNSLKSCLLNNDKFLFVPVKMHHIDEIRTKIVYVPQEDGETDEDYSNRRERHHKWFENMISTRPINGEGIENYHLRMIRLGLVSLVRENLRLFYTDFIKNEKNHLKIYDVKNNFSDTEFFVTHIICNCLLPASEIKRSENVPKSKNVRGESSQYQGESSKRHRGT